MTMNLNLNNIISTLKQIFVIVSVLGGTVVTLKIFGVQVAALPGSILDWSAVTVATTPASK